MTYLIWALAGWCGTPWRHWPRPTPPPPGDPWMWWKAAGILGGLGGGILAASLFDSDPMPGILGAFIGGRVLGDVVDRLFVR